MTENGRYSGAHILIAFLGGAVAGAAVAFLTTPQSGAEAREKVRGWAQDLGGKAGKLPRAVQDAYGRAADAAKQAFVEAYHRDAVEKDKVV